MRRIVVGVYQLGPDDVQLVLCAGGSACFYTRPEKGQIGRIEVGGDHRAWSRVVENAHHEAMEFAMMKMGLRFAPMPDYANENGGYLFVMTHTQFSEAGARAGMFLAAALPDLGRAWGRWRKRK